MLQGVKQAWTKIADAYNDPSWEPMNPTHHPFDLDDNANPVPVFNCSLARFKRLGSIDPNSSVCRIASAAFCQSLYKDIKTELAVAAEKNARSGWVPA